MLHRKDDINLKGIDIEIKLNDTQRSVLAAYVKQEGFDVVQKLMEDQVRKFNLKLINTDAADADSVLANHRLAKAVAQFYVGLMDRIEEECRIDHYNNGPKLPEESTEIEEWQGTDAAVIAEMQRST